MAGNYGIVMPSMSMRQNRQKCQLHVQGSKNTMYREGQKCQMTYFPQILIQNTVELVYSLISDAFYSIKFDWLIPKILFIY